MLSYAVVCCRLMYLGVTLAKPCSYRICGIFSARSCQGVYFLLFLGHLDDDIKCGALKAPGLSYAVVAWRNAGTYKNIKKKGSKREIERERKGEIGNRNKYRKEDRKKLEKRKRKKERRKEIENRRETKKDGQLRTSFRLGTPSAKLSQFFFFIILVTFPVFVRVVCPYSYTTCFPLLCSYVARLDTNTVQYDSTQSLRLQVFARMRATVLGSRENFVVRGHAEVIAIRDNKKRGLIAKTWLCRGFGCRLRRLCSDWGDTKKHRAS
uniref:Secreted peptide n=1 Tax=Rhipicephalus pulchellus TaxID=72859 RepID=L7LWB4_RHIPC